MLTKVTKKVFKKVFLFIRSSIELWWTQDIEKEVNSNIFSAKMKFIDVQRVQCIVQYIRPRVTADNTLKSTLLQENIELQPTF